MKKLLSMLLALCMLALMCNFAVPASADGKPGYLVKGEVSGGSFVVHVYLQNAMAYTGHLALAYDKDLLALTNKSSLTKAVKQASGVTVTAEGHDSSVLLGDGYVMFAWYSSKYTGVNAIDKDKEIATITFDLLGSESDFSRNTIGLYYVNDTMVDGWNNSCEIIANMGGRLNGYRNTSISEEYLCGIEYDYPNCSYVPPATYDVTVNVKNSDGKTLNAAVMIDNIEGETDIYGNAAFKLQEQTYFYRVSSPGYEIKSGYLIVDSDRRFNIVLRSYGQIAADEAAVLKIGYAEGDSAESVTTDLILPAELEYGKVSWSSSSNAVTDFGAVNRGEDDTEVKLVATVSVEQASAVKEFVLTVKSRLTAEEKNTAIVSQDKADLAIGYAPGDYAGGVTVNLTLPELGAAGSAISWQSDNEDIVYPTGIVKRPENDTEVTLTAYIVRGTVSDTKTFTVTVTGTGHPVPEEPSEQEDEYTEPEPPQQTVTDPAASREIVERVINTLEIGFASGNSAERVTDKLTLPSVGTDSTVIAWTSSLPAVVTPYGGVVRQVEDTAVTLTATVTHGDIAADKTFTVTVKAADEIPQNPNNGQEEEIAEKNSTRRKASTANGGAGGTGETAEVTPTPAPTPTATPEPEKQDTEETPTGRKQFTDIEAVPWAENAIKALTERGVINGTSDTTYSPNNNIRRADFVILLVKLLELDGEITDTFEDVAANEYYYSEVSKAKSLGIISGIDETHFNPEGSISRQDMMTMTYRALQKLGKADDLTAADVSIFKDADELSDYALDSVKYLLGGGYIHGDNSGYVTPRSNTTRAETAVFLYGLVQ